MKVCQAFLKNQPENTHGVPSGPVINALITSTRVSSTLRKIDEPQETGRLVVKMASYTTMSNDTRARDATIRTSFAIAKDRRGISELASIRASLL